MYNLLGYWLIYMLFFSGFVSFCLFRKHMLLTLLSLDYIGLSLFFLIINFLIDSWGELYIILLFLVFLVCEAVLGLSILVGVIRCHGNDNVGVLSSF
uniref:NADH-ubiquinone oxidoreductase chain 4L n=1 Tax=Nesidiocoris poppiusi TaxID=3059073 RepID=A0AAT9VW05_9HEMI|nr:NADH dehydrogenase subunit 4L [Nesidiocoris poppiusi]WKW91656.1 NADH dehydrogenase subunit 4L [Nesidiocoris poppiusi]